MARTPVISMTPKPVLSRGHLDVPSDIAGVEGFVVDGETHLYYGIVPAVARLPISAITSAADGRLVVLSQVLRWASPASPPPACCSAGRRPAGSRPAAMVAVDHGGFALAVGVSSPLLWLSSEALVYHEAELWGAALHWPASTESLVGGAPRARPPWRRGARHGGTVRPSILGDGPGVGAGRAGDRSRRAAGVAPRCVGPRRRRDPDPALRVRQPGALRRAVVDPVRSPSPERVLGRPTRRWPTTAGRCSA